MEKTTDSAPTCCACGGAAQLSFHPAGWIVEQAWVCLDCARKAGLSRLEWDDAKMRAELRAGRSVAEVSARYGVPVWILRLQVKEMREEEEQE